MKDRETGHSKRALEVLKFKVGETVHLEDLARWSEMTVPQCSSAIGNLQRHWDIDRPGRMKCVFWGPRGAKLEMHDAAQARRDEKQLTLNEVTPTPPTSTSIPVIMAHKAIEKMTADELVDFYFWLEAKVNQ